jgi:hypothetical protein
MSRSLLDIAFASPDVSELLTPLKAEEGSLLPSLIEHDVRE